MAILDDLIDTRCALESQMAAQAAERATDAEVEAISAHMARLYDEVDDPARYLRADLAFHDAIMRASGNRLARAVIHTINAEAFRSFRYLGETTPADCRESNVAHQAIHDRIVARDTGGADTAMTDHIRGSWHRRRPKDGARPPKRAAADS
jgi:DNA-binding FadR family transcriptional regulator